MEADNRGAAFAPADVLTFARKFPADVVHSTTVREKASLPQSGRPIVSPIPGARESTGATRDEPASSSTSVPPPEPPWPVPGYLPGGAKLDPSSARMSPVAKAYFEQKAHEASLKAVEAARSSGKRTLCASSRQPRRWSTPVPRDTACVTPDPPTPTSPIADNRTKDVPEIGPGDRTEFLIPDTGTYVASEEPGHYSRRN
eukprot:16434513-Heterocapsa_arctica.AAC.1